MSAAMPEKGKMGQLVDWIDARFPMTRFMKEHASEYYAPKNFNLWYYFGSLAMVVPLRTHRNKRFVHDLTIVHAAWTIHQAWTPCPKPRPQQRPCSRPP